MPWHFKATRRSAIALHGRAYPLQPFAFRRLSSPCHRPAKPCLAVAKHRSGMPCRCQALCAVPCRCRSGPGNTPPVKALPSHSALRISLPRPALPLPFHAYTAMPLLRSARQFITKPRLAVATRGLPSHRITVPLRMFALPGNAFAFPFITLLSHCRAPLGQSIQCRSSAILRAARASYATASHNSAGLFHSNDTLRIAFAALGVIAQCIAAAV